MWKFIYINLRCAEEKSRPAGRSTPAHTLNATFERATKPLLRAKGRKLEQYIIPVVRHI